MAKKDTDKIYEAEQRVEAKARGFFERNSKIMKWTLLILR